VQTAKAWDRGRKPRIHSSFKIASMKKILQATVPLTSRIAPALGAILILVGLLASSKVHMAQVSTSSPTITTDKSDYAPGETVVMSGSGWIPGQPVALHLEESDNDLPWDSSATPDAAGNFSISEFVIQAHDIGVVFTLTATQGGVVATTQFTDVVGAGIALNGDPGGFEIQGGVVATAGGGHTDWIANGVGTTGLLTNPGGVPIDSTVTFRSLDAYTSNDDIFAGSHTINDNPNTYTWKTGSAGNKSDLNNVYVHISKDSSGHRWVTASADRLSNNGTAFVDFELTQAGLTQITDVGCSSAPCGHFETNPAGAVLGDPLFATGGRTPNDLLVTAQYNSGGAVASIIVYQWKLVSGTYQWSDITSSIAVGTAFVATNTVDGVSVPYGAFGATTYSKNQFVEMSLDATALITAAVDPCSGIQVHDVFVRTKTSTTATSVLDDFVTPVAVTFNVGFTVSLTQSAVSCFGGSNGSVTATINGGTPPYSVTLGATTQTVSTDGGSTTFTGLTAGSKTVHVVATGGCTKDAMITVTQPASAVSASITSQTNASCFGGSTGSVTVAGSGGTSPYSYAIDGVTFGISGTFNNLAAGPYTVTVKDANGCTTTQPVTITQPASALTASALATNPSCSSGTGSITVTASGGTGTLSYSKDGTNFQSSNVFSGLAAGSYTITVKDANGCTTTTGATVTVPPAVTTSSTEKNPLCSGQLGSMTVTFSGGTPGYQCKLDNGSFTPCGSPATFNGLSAGSHTVSVKDSQGCLGPNQTKTVTVPTAVNASVMTTAVSSPGATDGAIKITVTGGTAPYTVKIGAVTKNIATSGGSTTFTGLASGGYTVNISDANGCSIGIATEIGTPTVQVSLCSILSSLGTGVSTVFKVTLVKGPLATPVTVSYAMSGTAIFGKDYSLSGIFGKITIPAGQTSATVTITALRNITRTTDRTATMTIINGPGYFATAPSNTATVIIRH